MTRLCPACFGEPGLRRRLVEIRPDYDAGPCDYHPKRKGIPTEAVAQIVDEVFRGNYTFGEGHYYEGDEYEPPAYRGQLGEHFRTIVGGLIQPEDDTVTDAVADQMIEDDPYWPPDGEEPFYDDGLRYQRIVDDDHGHGLLWERFCQSVTHDQRFLNPQVAEWLGEIFRHIHLQRDAARNPPVCVIRPGDGRRIFRARLAAENDVRDFQLDPAAQLGPPPARSGRPNRMNPSGIRALYGAFDLATCVSELRPRVGERVVGAEFELLRDIVVLDTTRFAAPAKELNIFAKDHVRRLAQWRFMQRFMTEIARPISPRDEHLDYVPTQVVAEYLNRVHEVKIDKVDRHIDAILYRSAQRPAGCNIVLLGDAAIVKIDPPPPERSLFPSMRLRGPEPRLAYVEGSLRSASVSSAEYATGETRPLRRILPSDPPPTLFPTFFDLRDQGEQAD